MPTFYDSKNKPYVLGEQIGRGGEGSVFFCRDDETLVAKIYHEPIAPDKAEKLCWMAENKDERLLKTAAWVIDVLRDRPDGKVVGFLMPNVRAKEIHELYSLKSRRIYFPDATWHFLVHTAANVARAFYALHARGHVMGDVNHGNCVVLADGTVKLIDCDSYSIKTDKKRYRCEVGVATHLAPELQGINLGNIEREPNHDNFGLAVIIFQLLFLGRHPFAGNYLGDEDKSLEDCIREHRFAYGENAELKRVRRPPGTLSLKQVSPRVAELFERAFSPSNKNRPEPREWIEALEDLSSNLEQCTFHPGHHYFNKLANCPWCAIESQTGVLLFPFVTSSKNGDGEKPFNIFTVESLVANLGISTNLPAKPLKPEILPMPSPEVAALHRTNRNRQIFIVGAHFFILTILMAVFGVGSSCFLGFLLMAVFIADLNQSEKSLRGEIVDRLTKAQSEWERLETEWSGALVPKKLTDDLALIKARINDYQNLQKEAVRRLQSFDRARNLEDYRRTLELSAAKIPGVETEHINALKAHGIRTAADLKEENLERVFILHNETKENLLRWRETVEKNFSADGRHPEKERFTRQTAEKRRALEREIEYLFSSLRSGSVALRQRQQEIAVRAEKAGTALAQAESDMASAGSNSLAVLILLLITFIMPFIGIFFSGLNSSNNSSTFSQKAPPAPPAPPPPLHGEGRTVISKAPLGQADVDSDVPDESITDKKIAEMSLADKQFYANVLFRQAGNLKYGEEKNLAAAETKLRFALRFDSENPLILNELADTLYEQKKYSEAIEFLERLLNEEPAGNAAAQIRLARSYIQTKQSGKARDILIDVTANDASSFEGYYNLGLAYKGLKDYYAAEGAFREAVRINPSDAESHYELGYSYYKQGKILDAAQEYKTLLGLDEELAERLKKEAKF